MVPSTPTTSDPPPELSTWIIALRLGGCAAVLGYAMVSIVLGRNLVADGSWAFLQGLLAEGIWPVDPYRTVVGTLGQTPFALGVAAGIDDLLVLRVLHGVGYVLLPTIAWLLALLLSLRTSYFELLLLGYCATVLTSGFVAVSDANSVFAYSALYFAAVARFTVTGGRALAYVGLSTSLLLMFSHGFTVLLSPFLLVATILLRRRSEFSPQLRWVWRLSQATLALGALVGFMSIIRPYSPLNVIAAADVSAPLENSQFILMSAWLVALPTAFLVPHPWARRIASAVLVVMLIWFVADDRLWASPLEQHATRTMSAIILLLLLLIALFVILRERSMEEHDDSHDRVGATPVLTVLSSALLVALMVPSVAAGVAFRTYLEDFRVAIGDQGGVLTAEDLARVVPAARTYDWPYSYSVLSVVLGAGTLHAVVSDPLDSPYVRLVNSEDPPRIPVRYSGSVVGP